MSEQVSDYLSFLDPHPPSAPIPGEIVDAELEQPPAEVTPSGPFDLAAAKVSLAPYKARVEEMVKQAEAFKITDAVTYKMANEMGQQAARMAKEVESWRLGIVKEPTSFVDAVNALCKPYRVMLDDIKKKIMSPKIIAYDAHLRLERARMEEIARQAREEEQKKIDAEAKRLNVEAPKLPEMVMPKQAGTVRTEAGTTHSRENWVWEVEDESKITDEYWLRSLDGRKLDARVKEGMREIPGIRIFQKAQAIFKG